MSKYMTRANVLRCIELFGDHFQPHFPLIHPATFVLAETPAALVLAITLGGACYAEGLIPAGMLTKFAMQLLLLIQGLPVSPELALPPGCDDDGGVKPFFFAYGFQA
jgi:hypothetical protein